MGCSSGTRPPCSGSPTGWAPAWTGTAGDPASTVAWGRDSVAQGATTFVQGAKGMQEGVQELVERRMKRALAAILGMKEREVDAYLPEPLAAKLRRVILDEFNDFEQVIVD